MKYANQIVFLLSSLVFLGLNTNTYGNPQTDQGNLSNDSPGILGPRRPIPAPKLGTEYTMKNIKPSPYIDYKIVNVMPDPSINYTIRNVGPKLGNPCMWGNGRLDGTGRKGYRRK